SSGFGTWTESPLCAPIAENSQTQAGLRIDSDRVLARRSRSHGGFLAVDQDFRLFSLFLSKQPVRADKAADCPQHQREVSDPDRSGFRVDCACFEALAGYRPIPFVDIEIRN